MNKPTALFFTACHHLYGGDEDAAGVAYDLVRSTGFTGFGRGRRMAALEVVAPALARALRVVGCDIIYVEADNPRACYRAAAREYARAEAAGPDLHLSEAPDGWRSWVWVALYRLQEQAEYERLGLPGFDLTRV